MATTKSKKSTSTRAKSASSQARQTGQKGKKSKTSAPAKTARAASSKKSAQGKSVAAASAKKAGGRGRSNPAFMRPMNIKEPLAAIVGNKPLPRTEVVKKVWEYIRKNHLQDEVNRRQINADDKLRRVFGDRDSVTMFEMTKLINQNMF